MPARVRRIVTDQDRPAILVLCLGNDLRRDDGVGWHVADALAAGPAAGMDVRRSAQSGIYLIDELMGFDRAIVVDAMQTGTRAPGTVFSFPLDLLEATPGPSPHSMGLPTVFAIGRRLGLPLPTRVHVVAIEVEDMGTLEIGLTPPVQRAVSRAEQEVRTLLARLRNQA
jgi:hydrogenase maturation protease